MMTRMVFIAALAVTLSLTVGETSEVMELDAGDLGESRSRNTVKQTVVHVTLATQSETGRACASGSLSPGNILPDNCFRTLLPSRQARAWGSRPSLLATFRR